MHSYLICIIISVNSISFVTMIGERRMKKIAVILFCLLTTLFLFACKNGNKEIKPGVLQVGYGRMDITPYNFSMPMNGYGNNNE